MLKIIVASKNPVKVSGTLSGFQKMFPNEEFEIQGFDIDSGISDQPKTDTETFEGAMNRTVNAKRTCPQADF